MKDPPHCINAISETKIEHVLSCPSNMQSFSARLAQSVEHETLKHAIFLLCYKGLVQSITEN